MKSIHLAILLLLFVLQFATLRVVNTSYGKLRGITYRSVNGQKNHIFKAVPFAKPPLGELRFQFPQPPESWNGVKDATNYSAACMSDSYYTSSPQKFIGEDCLYINIFVSDQCLKSRCPVIVYLHGGAFSTDSATMFPDQFIIDRYSSQGIVFAIPAMRLGVFGLLTFGDEDDTHENLAAYDALAALSYVKNEISNFGGKENDITIMGHSSGGTLSVLLAFSRKIDPHKELFQKAMAFSSPLNMNRRELSISNSYELAKRLNCHNDNSTNINAIVSCLRKLPAKSLSDVQKQMESEGLKIENLNKGPPFMDYDETIENLKATAPSRKLIIGCTNEEFGKTQSMHWNPALPGGFLDFENPRDVAQKFYNDHESGEYVFNSNSHAVWVSARSYAESMTKRNGEVFIFESSQKPKSSHISDMIYFVGIHPPKEMTKDMEILDSFYSKMLVNFTKYGKPSLNWEPFDIQRSNYLALEVDTANGVGPENLDGFHDKEYNYWTINMTSYDAEMTKTKDLENVATSLQPMKPEVAEGETKKTVTVVPTSSSAIVYNSTALSSRETSSHSIDSREDDSSFTSQWWFYVLIVIVVLAIIALISFIIRSCVLTEEETPLLSR